MRSIVDMSGFNQEVGCAPTTNSTCFEIWDREAESTVKVLRALPASQYDFRPDATGRSLGELAWHLAESDAYMSYGIEAGGFAMDMKPPNIERPSTVEQLAPGFELIHREAVARIRKLKPEDLDRSIVFFTSQPMTIRDILWAATSITGSITGAN